MELLTTKKKTLNKMRTIKKAQSGDILKSAAKSAAKFFSSKAKKSAPKAASSASNAAPKRKFSDAFKDLGDEYNRTIRTNPNRSRISAEEIKNIINKQQGYPKDRNGGKLKKAKSGKSFPDLNKDGKITRADILKGRGVIKNGGKLKKAMNGTTTPKQRRARTVASMAREASVMRKARTAARPMMKKGGSVKKAMGGYKMMKMGGKCRGGCY